ncbi:hypothetical protein [Rathayibacter festucae]|uniref:hypothetical protein n=1 Tax=Rathayibacter festucae TaxID=110937 RepID=UPI002A6B59C5|nr:hypothetical protein [Rathayibacter festucae]MDY0914655.1 hypothetical protein [Rathayibacter festucae]
MTSSHRPAPERLASVALFATILVVGIGVALGTDLHPVVRVAVSVSSGLIVATITLVIARARSGSGQ